MAPLTPEHVVLHVDRSGLTAKIALTPEGEAAYEADAMTAILNIIHILRDRGVRDVDEQAVREWAAERQFRRAVVVATGTPPTHGEDGAIDLVFERKREEHEQERDAADQVDYREWNTIHTVQPGEVLARLLPPTPGVEGCTVLGEVVPAKAGRAAKLKPGKNVEVVDTVDGVQEFTSQIEGLAQRRGATLSVSPAYVVNGDVDLAVGNIHFNGDVLVRGDVRENLTVEATGDIEVHGSVERSALSAGGDIRIAGTIYGKEGVWVRAGGTLKAESAENANVETQGDLILHGNVIQSHVIAGHAYLGHETNGHVRGGVVEASQGITVGSIGSPDFSVLTHLEIRWAEGLVAQLREFKREQDKLTLDRGNVERQLLTLRRAEEQGRELSPNQATRLKDLEAAAHAVRERETELQFLRQEIGERVEASRRSAITVHGEIHPDARLVIHGKALAIQEHHGALQVTVTKEGLQTGPAPAPAAA